ncbi:hypothetical protein D3C76_972020 [compost metagenome]
MEIPIGLRKPDKCGYYGKHLLFHASRKNRRQEICNSVLESDYCVLLEWDPLVISYASQPGELEVTVNGRLRHYRPDFRVDTCNSMYFTEVKYDFETLSPWSRAKLLAAQQVLAELGYGMLYADNKSIRCGWRLQNLKFLYFHSFNVSAEESVACQRWLRSFTYPLTLRELIKVDGPVRERAIYRAVFDRQLLVNLSERITLNSLVEKKS